MNAARDVVRKALMQGRGMKIRGEVRHCNVGQHCSHIVDRLCICLCKLCEHSKECDR